MHRFTIELLALPRLFFAIYATLLACYLGTGLVVTKLNRRRPERRIQKDRVTPAAQSRRDLRQSIISLAVIALSFSLGSWFYDQLGWGFHIKHMTALKMVLSFAASMYYTTRGSIGCIASSTTSASISASIAGIIWPRRRSCGRTPATRSSTIAFYNPTG